MHGENRTSCVGFTGASRCCSHCWGRGGTWDLLLPQTDQHSGRTQHLTLSSYQNCFWCPTLESQSPPYSEICIKIGKDNKTKQSHLPCSWQPDLDGYKTMWEYWPPASPTRLQADGKGTAEEFHVNLSPSVSSAISGRGTTLCCHYWGRR